MAVDEEEQGATESPGASSMFRSVGKVFLRVALLMVALSVVWFLSLALDSFVLRVIVGLILAAGAAGLGVNYFRQVGNPPPPDPVPTEVHPGLRLAYVCDMCGLELAVLKVAKDRAPKHCGEAMLLVRRPATGLAEPGPEPAPGPGPTP